VSGTLVLFDIDGTLIRRAGSAHRQSLVDAVHRVTGVRAGLDHIPLHGMLDPDILSWMMRDAGLAPGVIRRQMRAICAKAESLFTRRCPDLMEKTCPGVRTLLGRLDRRGVPMALVTGNLPRIGWRKMERAGLRGHFRSGAFAGMARDRAGLAAMAIREARRQGWVSPKARVVLIGDAGSDVIAAKANGALAVAVRTGVTPEAELAEAGPDILLDDLRQFRLSMLEG
jgi:phosphoglycolate phosphatase